MSPSASPRQWGGLVSLTILTLFVVPAVYVVWRSFQLAEVKS